MKGKQDFSFSNYLSFYNPFYIKRKGKFIIDYNYNNIINNVPTVIDLHGYANITMAKYLLEVKNNQFFKGITTINDYLKDKYYTLYEV